MKLKRTYTPLIALLALSGCFYAPDEEVFTEVTAPDLVGMISLSDYDDGDTIVLYNAAEFDYHVAINQGNIKEVAVRLGEKVLYNGSNTSGVFAIRNENLTTGIFELKIEFLTSSGTGSLLDRMGGEIFQLWRTWIVKIDVDPPPTPILDILPNTDFLTLQWQPYLKPNFVSYELLVNSGAMRIVIDDPMATSWADSIFLWGSKRYVVIVNTNLHSRASAEKVARYPQEVEFTYRAEDSTGLFTWRKSHFAGTFKEVEILENNESRVVVTSPLDTTLALKLNVGMGKRSMMHFYLRANHEDIGDLSERYYLDNPVGLKKLQSRMAWHYSVNMNRLVGFDYSEKQIKVFDSDLNTIAVDGSIPGSLHIPSLGPYIYFGTGSQLIQRHFGTKQETTVSATKRNGAATTMLSFGAGGNGNVVFTYVDDTDFSWKKEYCTKVYNINTGKLISLTRTTYNPNGTYKAPYLSDDGRFLSYSNSRAIYAVEDTIRSIGSAPLIGTFVGFREDNNEQIFLAGPSSIFVCSTWDFSILKTLPKPEPGFNFMNYDPATKNILLAGPTGSKAHLINVDTEEVRILPAYSDDYIFLGGILFQDDGHYLKVY